MDVYDYGDYQYAPPPADNAREDAFLKKVPPHDDEAELAAVSSMLFDVDALAVGYEMLKSDDFYRPDYRAVFEAMIELLLSSKPVDAVTLKNKLEEMNVYEAAGGRDGLALIAGGVSTSANIRHYCKIIADKSVFRRLLGVARELEAESYSAVKPVDDVLDEAQKSLVDVVQKRDNRAFTHIRDALVLAVEEIDRAAKSGGKVTGVETGFADFDAKTTGLHAAELILIAARPSVGKSALGINIAHHAAVRKGVPTAMFTLEMSKEQVVSRMLCAESMVDANKLRTGQLTSDEWRRVAEAVGSLSPAPFFIDDTAGLSIAQLRAKCRRLQLEHGLGLIVVDYLQLMTGGRRTENRQQEISEISRALKTIAGEMSVPVIALAQLSRAPELRADHRPMLSDLRESGAIEQDADVVSFIYRDEMYNPETEKRGIAEWIVAKQRNGSTGTVELLFMGQYAKFANLDKTN